jgi:predicted DNA repair protein MutK
MSGGLVALLDDVAALARLAAASIDDVGAAAGRASAKAAGVVVDDAAVTPRYVQGLKPERELSIIGRIAKGSLRNKLLIILPAALLLSQFAPWLLTPLLMVGGCYLCYEGAEKIWEKLSGHHAENDAPAVVQGPEHEATVVSGAVRTDFILSAEIMVIALNEVASEAFVPRAIILLVVAIAITVLVYGFVALLVKMDDVGLALTERSSAAAKRVGGWLVRGMPKVLTGLSVVGVVAMLWVGGHILLVGMDELGLHAPYSAVHHLEELVVDVSGVGGTLAWLINTVASALLGVVVGAIVVAVMHVIPRKRPGKQTPGKHADAASGDAAV